MDRYTHLGIVDLTAVLDALSALPSEGPSGEAAELLATGTDGSATIGEHQTFAAPEHTFNLVAQMVAKNSGIPCPLGSPDDHEAGEGEREEKPAKPGVFACFAGKNEGRPARTRTWDQGIMSPLTSTRKPKRQSKLGQGQIPVTVPVTGTGRKKTAEDAASAIGYPRAGDHLEGIVEAIRRLPEAQQAEVIRRLGEPRPDPSLTAIVAALPKLPAPTRAGVVATVKGLATGFATAP